MNYTIFGESHGPAIGVVLEDLPSGVPMDMDFIAAELRRRATGNSPLSTPRKEADQVEVLSGVFEGKTTGTPLCMMIRNGDQHSKDYAAIRYLARPGHADLTGFVRYGGYNDYRGGGHFSGRLTAPLGGRRCRCQADSAGKWRTGCGTHCRGGKRWDTPIDPVHPDMSALTACGQKPFPVLSDTKGEQMQALILEANPSWIPSAASLNVPVTGLPMGLGAPDFDLECRDGILPAAVCYPRHKGAGIR